MKKSQIWKLSISIILPLAVGGISGLYTYQSVSTWYITLNRPSFNPPNWIFGPVWTTLYILMGISFFLIWRLNRSKQRDRAIAAFLIQLTLNFAWSFIFFYHQLIGIALAEIILLWISIIVMIQTFYRVKPVAAYINIPYLLWVTFATVLNAAYSILN